MLHCSPGLENVTIKKISLHTTNRTDNGTGAFIYAHAIRGGEYNEKNWNTQEIRFRLSLLSCYFFFFTEREKRYKWTALGRREFGFVLELTGYLTRPRGLRVMQQSARTRAANGDGGGGIDVCCTSRYMTAKYAVATTV